MSAGQFTTNATGTPVARYAQGLNIDEPLAMLRIGTTSYFTRRLGSLASLSNTTGALANTYTYDSFGILVAFSGSIVNSFRYTGRELDPETSVYYYRARYYDAAAGRFISEDPIRGQGGINFYSYSRNNPVNLVDPFGLSPDTIPRPGTWPGVLPFPIVSPWVRAIGGGIGRIGVAECQRV